MDKLVHDGSLSAKVRTCITNSGGYGYTDGVNTILQTEMNLKYNYSVYAVPMVRVNQFIIHGSIDCYPPITKETCTVLAAICAGFINGTQPNVCNGGTLSPITAPITPLPTMSTTRNGIPYGAPTKGPTMRPSPIPTPSTTQRPSQQPTRLESSTGALLTFPNAIDGALFGQEFEVAPSEFGYQKWGGTLEGWLVLPANETYHKECPIHILR